MSDIAFVGDYDSILGFKALGAEIWALEKSDHQVEQKFKDILSKGYKIIYLTEELFYPLQNLIQEANQKVFPSIITIPSMGEKKYIARERLQRISERTLGVKLF